MKTIFGSVTTLAVLATPALAHPGEHDLTFLQSFTHFLTQPDHLYLLVVAVAAVVMISKIYQRKA